MATGVLITREQRDGLYQVLLTELSTFDDLRSAYERKEADIETSERLGRMVADALRLIVDGGVGWGDLSSAERVKLTLPESELGPLLDRVRSAAVSLLEALQPEYEEKLELLKEVEVARDACTAVLGQIQPGGTCES
jgi:hypothetical protein